MPTYKPFLRLIAMIVLAVLTGIGVDAAWAGLLITVGDPPGVQRYDQLTGAFLGYFVTPGSGGIDLPQTLAYGPDGNLYVASFGSRNVLRYNGVTGDFIDVFVPPGSGGLGGPYGVTFGPDGNLYVTSFFFTNTPGVLRYDGKTGAFIDLFVPGQFGIAAFGPGGNLYVSSTSGVLRFDGSTGKPFPAPGAGGAFFAAGDSLGAIAFGPNGDLFVASGCRNVARYDGRTGASLGPFVTDVPIPVQGQCITGVAFGPDGDFYVIGYYSTVFRYDRKTRNLVSSFGSGQRGTLGLAFMVPVEKKQCRNGGWQTFGFRNQGQCIRFVNGSEYDSEDRSNE